LHSIIVPLKISPEEFQRLYEGHVKEVSARSSDGRQVRFPANILRPFVTHFGVSGTFAIHFSEDKRFHSIEKID
jgi:predicted flavoprotein YhiN